MLFGNPNAKILDAHKDRMPIFRDTDQHGIRLGRILDGVVQEINQHLSDFVR